MCGIAGLTHSDDFALLPRLLGVMRYRGPDDLGQHIDERKTAALGMCRLSILDLAAGQQPMSNEDDSLWVVCNGEIYNAPALRKTLEAQGHRFKTDHSDTEVLLHLYEEKGEDMLKELNGMFAFVIHDLKRNRLFGARDRVGIKPLNYAHKGNRFAFASEMKCLLELPWVSRDIHSNSMYHYLSFQFVPAPQSIYKDIQKLPAGHYFIYDLDDHKLQVRRYWKLPVAPRHNVSTAEWTTLLREKMEEAVQRWTLSDVPIACSLSGGLDSAALVGLLAKGSREKIKTYTLGFNGNGEESFSELGLAKAASDKWGTEHHELVMDPTTLLNTLDKMVWHLDEPYGGGLPSWYIYEFIGRDCKVAMTGTGGDELFGNYGKWRIHERPSLYRPLKRTKDVILGDSRARELWDMFRAPHGHFYHRYLTDAAKDRFFSEPAREEGFESTEDLLERVWRSSGASNPRDAVAAVDFEMQLPEEFLHVTDRFSMAHSVEARVPFLDHELIELAFQVPAEVRTSVTHNKSLMKEIVKDLLPQELLSQPKRGFILPLSLWTRGALRPRIEEALSPAALKAQGYFSETLWTDIVQSHMEGRRNFTEQVWTLFMFQLWHKTVTAEVAC